LVKAAVVGATGYTGVELVRLLAGHPEVELVQLTSESYRGQKISEVYPSLDGWAELVCETLDPDQVTEKAEVVFVALPHGLAMGLVPRLLEAGVRVIDLGADFRLQDPADYETWYGKEHTCPDLIPKAVYGLPELNRSRVQGARIVANPGCYPTSVILGAAPLVAGRMVDPVGIVVDSKSGVSGAGRSLSLTTHFSEVNENFKAYNIAGKHRHTPEMEQELGRLWGGKVVISFSPHLVPMTRGILSTIYLDLKENLTYEQVIEVYREFYSHEPFIRLLPAGKLPQTKEVTGSNYCDIGVALDQRVNKVIVVTVIDNLVKGAAGQAVQNMNLLFGIRETTGLLGPGLYP